MGKRSSLLIDTDEKITLLTQLAVVIGDRQAIALQQIHYWCDINSRQKHKEDFFDDHWWTYNTWNDWKKNNFPFWSVPTIRRIFSDLDQMGLIVIRPHKNDKRGSWITVNYEQLEMVAKEKNKSIKTRRPKPHYPDQNDHGKTTYPDQNDQSTSDTETTYTETKDSSPEKIGDALPDSPTDSTPQEKPKKERPRNPWYDVVKAVWGYNGSYNIVMGKILRGESKDKRWARFNLEQPFTSAEQVSAWANWYRKTELNGNEKLNMLEDREKIASSVVNWFEAGCPGMRNPDDPTIGTVMEGLVVLE